MVFVLGKVAHKTRRLARPELIPVSVTWSNWGGWYSPLDGMLVHRRVAPSSMSPVPIYTPGWRETMWGKVSCLRKRHDGEDWASNHRPPDLKFNVRTTTPLRSYFLFWYFWVESLSTVCKILIVDVTIIKEIKSKHNTKCVLKFLFLRSLLSS